MTAMCRMGSAYSICKPLIEGFWMTDDGSGSSWLEWLQSLILIRPLEKGTLGVLVILAQYIPKLQFSLKCTCHKISEIPFLSFQPLQILCLDIFNLAKCSIKKVGLTCTSRLDVQLQMGNYRQILQILYLFLLVFQCNTEDLW